MKYETGAGQHIDDACKEAVALANEHQETVEFTFNDVEVKVNPSESPESVAARWNVDREAQHQAYISSPEYKERREREEREAEERRTRVLVETAQTEKEMREADVPWPQTKKQLMEYIDSLLDRSHDYGTAVYAMSMAATAAYYYASHIVGSSGFQASCADLDFIRRTRGMNGPFMLIKAEDALYPQYDLHGKLDEALAKWQPWIKEQAKEHLAKENLHTHSNVITHWEALAK